MKICDELTLVGHIIQLYSEELGYDTFFVKPNEFDKKINEIKENAKKIFTKNKSDYIYIDDIYTCKDGFICNDEIEEIPNQKVFIRRDAQKIEIEYNNKSKLLNDLLEPIKTEKYLTIDDRQYSIYDDIIYSEYEMYRIKNKEKFYREFDDFIKVKK